MGAITSPRQIATAAKLVFESSACLSTLAWFDWTPGTVGQIFERLPCGVVDFDVGTVAGFEQPHQGVKVTVQPLLVQLFYEITDADAGGQQADSEIWRLWWCAVNIIYGNRYLNHTVDGCRIRDGAVEGIPIQAEETGILCRYAWLSLEVWKTL